MLVAFLRSCLGFSVVGRNYY